MSTATAAPATVRRSTAARRGLLVWAAVVGLGLVWGVLAIADDPTQSIRAAPFAGHWRWHLDLRILPAAALGGAIVWAGPSLATRLRFRAMVVATGATATAWAFLLAASDGWSRVTAPLTTRHEYEPFASDITSAPTFVRHFTEHVPDYPIHVRGHPPGAPLTFWVLDRLGLGGAGWAAALVLVAWGVTAAAVVVSMAHVAGAHRARRAAPFVAVLPAAVWAGTSFDAVIAATVAVGATLVIAGACRPSQSSAIAAAGGVVLGLSLFLSYGAAPLLLVPVAVAVSRRAWPAMAWAGAGLLVVVGGFALAGFWWLDGLAATRQAYWAGVAARRSGPYFLLAGNPAALLVATGPAWVVGLTGGARLDRRWLLVLAALVAVVAADLSGLSKGEVERIWLPFVPWLALAAAAAIPPRVGRALLGAQVGLALTVEVALRSPW